MKILVIGSGAREHALAWKMACSGHAIDAAPGNPGIAKVATCHDVPVEEIEGLVALAKRLGSELVVVGPEVPLVMGLADRLRAEGIPVFGPSQAAAAIEGSKAFAKELMRAAGVPTADWKEFTERDGAEAYAVSLGRAVVKLDGLAAGKGVIVASDAEAAREAVRSLMPGSGKSPERVIVEEFLEGEEASAIALCDGSHYWMLPAAQDHKRIGEGDTGPNTGGMGTYSPLKILGDAELERVGQTVIAPILAEMARRGTPFVGALFAGLMMTARGAKVLEYNCRFGDPETQSLMMRLEGDLAPVLRDCALGTLGEVALRIKPQAAVGVVLAASGYPGTVRKNDPIHGLEAVAESDRLAVFHAGTRRQGEAVVTAGGRVLTVVALGDDVAQARASAYRAIESIHFEGMQLRRDIAVRGL